MSIPENIQCNSCGLFFDCEKCNGKYHPPCFDYMEKKFTDAQQRYAKIAAELEQCAVDMNSDKLIPIVSNLNEWARKLRQ